MTPEERKAAVPETLRRYQETCRKGQNAITRDLTGLPVGSVFTDNVANLQAEWDKCRRADLMLLHLDVTNADRARLFAVAAFLAPDELLALAILDHADNFSACYPSWQDACLSMLISGICGFMSEEYAPRADIVRTYFPKPL